MTARHAGRVAIVTGAAGGIGLGIARRLQADGARVVLWDQSFDRLKPGAVEAAMTQVVDVTDLARVEQAFAEVEDTLGPVDILVNNAGINGPVMPSWELPPETWAQILSVNLTGVWHGCRVAIPFMKARGYGRIVNTASMAAKDGVPFIAGYSAAKGGVVAMTKAIAKEIAQDGITINCIAPALTETELFSQMTQEHIDAMRAKIPMGRTCKISEAADLVSWIASEECSFTTGFTFDLSGGRATY